MHEETIISNADRHADRWPRIRYSYHHPAVVVQVAGEINPATMPQVRHGIQAALKGAVEPFPVVLDLSEVTVVSDACLDGVVSLHQQAHGQRTPLRVVADGPVLRALTGAGVDRILSLHPTLAAATRFITPVEEFGGDQADCGSGERPQRPPHTSRHYRVGTGPRRTVRREPLRIERAAHGDVVVVVPAGRLDLVSYEQLRTRLIKEAMSVPRAVIVDLRQLVVVEDTSLVVFTSVWKEVSDWPGVPLHLVTADPTTKTRLARNGIVRYIPVHDTLDEALDGLDQAPTWRRAVLTIRRGATSGTRARRHVEHTCRRWACVDNLVADATIIAVELVDNALQHTAGDIRLRLELRCGELIIAVHDDTSTPTSPLDGRHTPPPARPPHG